MFKINKSILIVCIISLFILIGQASATDTGSLELNDLNSYDSIENGNSIANAYSNELNHNDASENSFYTNDNADSIDDDLSIENDISIDDECNEENENGQDGEKSVIVEGESKDTSGIVMSNDDFSCGPASLATALNKFGLNLSLNEISKHTNTSLNGTSMQSLIDAARYYNFSAVGVEIDTGKLKENTIVHLNINGNEHWTVLSKLTETHAFLADSTMGNVNLSLDEFNSFFTQKAIILSANSQNDLNKEMIENQIRILDKKQTLIIFAKGMKKKVIGYKTVWKYGMIAKYGWVLRPVVSKGHVSFSQWKYVKGTYYVWGKYKVLQPIYKYYYVADDALTSAKIKKSKN